LYQTGQLFTKYGGYFFWFYVTHIAALSILHGNLHSSFLECGFKLLKFVFNGSVDNGVIDSDGHAAFQGDLPGMQKEHFSPVFFSSHFAAYQPDLIRPFS
jgi:hypothetical protein